MRIYTRNDLTTALLLALGAKPRERCDREPHQPTDACSRFHCYSHNVDEPINPDSHHGFCCGECFHYYPTRLHLWIDHKRGATPIYRAELQQRRDERTARRVRTTGQPTTIAPGTTPTHDGYDRFAALLTELNATTNINDIFPKPRPTTYGTILRMIAGHIFTRPSRITFCPHCTHDL